MSRKKPSSVHPQEGRHSDALRAASQDESLWDDSNTSPSTQPLATASCQTKSLIVTGCPALGVTKENPSFLCHSSPSTRRTHGWCYMLSGSHYHCFCWWIKRKGDHYLKSDQEYGQLSKSFQMMLFTINVRFTRKVIWKPIPVLFLCLVPHFWEEAWILKLKFKLCFFPCWIAKN